MSILRTGIILAAAVMLLPVEDKKQTDFTATASTTAEQTLSFCTRNPSTCDTGRDLWALFVRKAEYGVELGARLVREQLFKGAAETPDSRKAAGSHQPLPALSPALPQPNARIEPAVAVTTHREPTQSRRPSHPTDVSSSWR